MRNIAIIVMYLIARLAIRMSWMTEGEIIVFALVWLIVNEIYKDAVKR